MIIPPIDYERLYALHPELRDIFDHNSSSLPDEAVIHAKSNPVPYKRNGVAGLCAPVDYERYVNR